MRSFFSHIPRFGQTFAKCDGSPQTKHLLPDTGSPVADTKVVSLVRAPLWRPLPRSPLPRPPLLLGLDAELLAVAGWALLPPLLLLRLSSHLHPSIMVLCKPIVRQTGERKTYFIWDHSDYVTLFVNLENNHFGKIKYTNSGNCFWFYSGAEKSWV